MAASRRSAPPPLAVFHPPRAVSLLGSRAGALLLLLLVSLAAAAVRPETPWPSAWSASPATGLLVFASAALILLIVAHAWARPRAGRAELHADRLVVRSGSTVTTLFLEEVLAFDDARGDLVRVRARSTTDDALDVVVPTPEEKARVALLEALSRSGAPRLEREREPLPADPVRLVLDGRAPWREYVTALASVSLAGAGVALQQVSPWLVLTLLAAAAYMAGGALLFAAFLQPGRAGPRGRFVLHDRRIVALHAAWWCPGLKRRTVLCWDDVVAWHGSSPYELRLMLRDGLLLAIRGDLALPTRTPEARGALERLLEEKRVPRFAPGVWFSSTTS